jgi:hypothetical protein
MNGRHSTFKTSSAPAAFAVGAGARLKICLVLLAILLNARGAQSGEAVLVEAALPGEIFFRCERVTLTGFFQAQEAPAHGCYHLCLAADDPAMAAGWREISNCQRAPVGADDIVDAGTQLTVSVHTLLLTHTHGTLRNWRFQLVQLKATLREAS